MGDRRSRGFSLTIEQKVDIILKELERAKVEANGAFRNRNYATAVRTYTECLDLILTGLGSVERSFLQWQQQQVRGLYAGSGSGSETASPEGGSSGSSAANTSSSAAERGRGENQPTAEGREQDEAQRRFSRRPDTEETYQERLDRLHLQFLCNRAMCYIRLRQFDLAEQDSTDALALDPSNAKALYRRACAREEQGRLTESLLDAQTLLQRGQDQLDARDRRQVDELIRRVREKLLREQQEENDMQQPRILITTAFSPENISSSEERAACVRKAAAMLLSNPDRRNRFVIEGSLQRVCHYLANAPAPQKMQDQKKEEKQEKEKGMRGGQQATWIEGEEEVLACMTPGVEAACWELLFCCIVNESVEHDSLRRHERERNTSTLGSGGSGRSSRTAGETQEGGRRQQEDRYATYTCLKLVRQKWSSEQLLLRLRGLLRQTGMTTTIITAQGPWERKTVAQSNSKEEKGGITAVSPVLPETEGIQKAGGTTQQKTAGRREDSEKEEEESRSQACCLILLLMGQLEQLNAASFEDDNSFCTACLIGMQQTTSMDLQLAAVEAASTAALARRKMSLQQAPALALRQNVEKWMEELLQLLAEVQHQTFTIANLKQQQHEQQQQREQRQQQPTATQGALSGGENTGSGGGAGGEHGLNNMSAAEKQKNILMKRDCMEAQVQCLLVTLVTLLVDKDRALPPLFATAASSSRARPAAAATCEPADIARLLEQLLTPYLPLSSKMLPEWKQSMCNNEEKREVAAGGGGLGEDTDDDLITAAERNHRRAEEMILTRSKASSSRMNMVGGMGCSLAWPSDGDVEEAVKLQIVGLKVLRLLLPAAREEIAQILISDICGPTLRFAVAAATDDVNVRLPHTPRLLWLQQQIAAAELLVPAMEFPQLRVRLLQTGGLEPLASILTTYCKNTTSSSSSSSSVLSVSSASSALSESAAPSTETVMRWVLCGKVAAVLARLAVHHEEVRVQVFDLVDFTQVLARLLQRWEKEEAEKQERQQTLETIVNENHGSNIFLAMARDIAINAASRWEGREGALVPCDDACQDFVEVFCFVSLHASFKEHLVAADSNGNGDELLPRLLRLARTAFAPATGDADDNGRRNNDYDGSNRSLVVLLLLQGLCNLMRSRDDRKRRPNSRRPGGGLGMPQLDEEQQGQLEEFFTQLPREAQPPRNGEIDAGGRETAAALQKRLVEYGVVRVVSTIVLSSLRAAAAAISEQEESERAEMRGRGGPRTNNKRKIAVKVLYQHQLSPNAVVAAADAIAALAANPTFRGIVVREGGLRLLLAVISFLEKCGDGFTVYEGEQRDARQALARLCITVNPTLLSYQEKHEAIGYIVPLLRDRHELLQYEGALALTNLTADGPEAQTHAWHAGAWDSLEELLFSDNAMLRSAGLEGWCNLADSSVVQSAIGERCERLWQEQREQQGRRARGEGEEDAAEARNDRRQATSGRSDGDRNSRYEAQCLRILLAYCAEDENVRARSAAVATLAMLVTDPRTAAAVARCSNFSNLCGCLDNAEVNYNSNNTRVSAADFAKYSGMSLILRLVATMNHIWSTLKDSDYRRQCDFDATVDRLKAALTRNSDKLIGVASDLGRQLILQA